jgi:F-type H+-transporting ATPase subunit b
MKVEIDQIITQIISFLIILWILSRYAWKPLVKLLDERKQRIHSEQVAIDTQRKELDDLTKEYQQKLKQLDAEAQSKVAALIEEAKLQAEAIQAQAKQQARAILLQTQADLHKEILAAQVKMKNELVAISIACAEKLLEKNLDGDEQKKYAAACIEQMRMP